MILGENRYIRVEQSVEIEEGESEQEYCYSVYENGKLVERSAFSYETEENETELKMTSFKDGKTQVLYFEREIEKGEEVIEIHVGDGKHGKGYVVRIEKDENGVNRYSFVPTEFDDWLKLQTCKRLTAIDRNRKPADRQERILVTGKRLNN